MSLREIRNAMRAMMTTNLRVESHEGAARTTETDMATTTLENNDVIG